MGKVDRLRNRMNLLLPCFGLWALYLPTPDPARRHHSTAVHKACPYMVIVGSIQNEDALPPFLSRSIIYLCLWLRECESMMSDECRVCHEIF